MKRIHWYVLGVTVTALVVAKAVYELRPDFEPGSSNAVIWLCLLGFIALLQQHSLPKGGGGSTAFIPFLACALIAPSWITVAAVGAANLVAELISRRAPLKVTFNVAQMSLAIGLAILVYQLLGGQSLVILQHTSLVDSSLIILLPFVALLSVFFAVNTFAVSAAIAATTHGNVVRVWKQNTFGAIAYDVLSGPIVFLFAWFYVKSGPLGAAGLAIPLLGARQLYKTNRQLERLNEELLQLMVKAIEARDPYTSGHSRRVARYSKLIAQALGLSSRRIEVVAVAALLHDVGKIHEIYAPILRKPARLTPDEWAIMKTHPVKSAELVETVSHLKHLVAPVRHHHENWDGTGYPDGIAGDAIPLESRIIMFADTIDAMTTDRPYRKALGESDVRGELVKHRGSQFDPQICDRLLSSPMFGLLFAPDPRGMVPLEIRRVATPQGVRLVSGL
ncbi:MAG: HD-GYP domain-containing protein [Gemmatimonadaceae bacterium]